MAITRRPAPGERFPEVNEGASSAQFAPVSPAAMTSTISAILAPRAPPKASSAPRSAACGSVVGSPSASTAQPSRQRLAAFGIMSELDEGGRARRLVDEQRRPFVERRGEGDRIRAIDGLLRSGDRHQRRPAGRGESDEAGLRETARVIAEFAGGVASVLREQRDPEGLGAAAKIVEDAVEAELRDPAACVAMDRGRGRRSQDRLGVARRSAPPAKRRDSRRDGKSRSSLCRARWRRRSPARATSAASSLKPAARPARTARPVASSRLRRRVMRTPAPCASAPRPADGT